MKLVKYGLLGILVGQLIVLFTKDDKLKKELAKANGMRKLKVLGDELINFNKEVLDYVKNIDYKSNMDKLSKLVKDKESIFEDKIKELKSKAVEFSKGDLKKVLEEIELKVGEMVDYAKETIDSRLQKDVQVKTPKKKSSAKKAPAKKTIAAKKTLGSSVKKEVKKTVDKIVDKIAKTETKKATPIKVTPKKPAVKKAPIKKIVKKEVKPVAKKVVKSVSKKVKK